MKLTRFQLAAVVALVGALSFQPLARAQDDSAPPKPAAGKGPAAPHERLQQIAKELNLTDEQRQKVQTIMREQMQKANELRKDDSLSQQERMEKLKALRQEAMPKIKEILTPEQFEKWQQKRQEMGQNAPRPGARLQEIIQSLNLTDEQKEKLKPIFEEQREKMRDLFQDQSLTPQEKMEKMKEMRAEVMPKLKSALNKEQFDSLQKKLEQGMGQIQKRLQQNKEN